MNKHSRLADSYLVQRSASQQSLVKVKTAGDNVQKKTFKQLKVKTFKLFEGANKYY